MMIIAKCFIVLIALGLVVIAVTGLSIAIMFPLDILSTLICRVDNNKNDE